MQDTPGDQAAPPSVTPPPAGNPLLSVVQRPRMMLVLLCLWSIVGVLTQVFTSSPLFLENHNAGDLDMDGALAGLSLGWEGIPLAVLYFYCLRDPVQYRSIFWLALVHQGALFSSNLYHWLVTGEFTFESVVIPLSVSAALGVLIFLHLFHPRDLEAHTRQMSAAPD